MVSGNGERRLGRTTLGDIRRSVSAWRHHSPTLPLAAAGVFQPADALGLIESGHFVPGDPDLFRPFVRTLVEEDPYLVLADFRSYVEAHGQVSKAWSDVVRWTSASILNVARTGRFSSDRSIRDYVREVWHARPVKLAPVA